MRSKLTILLLLACVTFLPGQAEKKSFLHHLGSKYEGIEALHASLEIGNGNRTEQVEVWYNSENSLVKSNEFEVLLNATHYIVVNKQHKSIHYTETTNNDARPQASKQYQLPIDSLIKICKSVRVDSFPASNEINVQMKLEHPGVQSMELKLDYELSLLASTYEVSQPFSNNTVTISMKYLVFEVNPALSADRFATRQYLEGDRPSSPFSNFQILRL